MTDTFPSFLIKAVFDREFNELSAQTHLSQLQGHQLAINYVEKGIICAHAVEERVYAAFFQELRKVIVEALQIIIIFSVRVEEYPCGIPCSPNVRST